MDLVTLRNCVTAVAVMTCLDIVTGVIRAACAGEISSAGWFRGLLRKSAIAGCFALAVALEWTEMVLDVGVAVPLMVPVTTYICVTEATSTYENIVSTDPSMRPNSLEGLFAVNSAVDDLDDDEEGDQDV